MKFVPLKGKKCLLNISLADAYVEAGPSFNPGTIIDLFRKKLSQSLQRYGIEIVDNDNPTHDIVLSVQFTKILRGFPSLLPVFPSLLQRYDFFNWAYLYPQRKQDSEPVVGLKSKILVGDAELQEAAITARLSWSEFRISNQRRRLEKCLVLAAKSLSSLSIPILMNYYVNNYVPKERVVKMNLDRQLNLFSFLKIFLAFFLIISLLLWLLASWGKR